MTTGVRESTGVSWIPRFQILEARGFEVALVNARHVKNVPGRPTTDRFDCRWRQKLQTSGLLARAFRPPEDLGRLRRLLRHRETLIRMTVQHMQPSRAFRKFVTSYRRLCPRRKYDIGSKAT